MEALKPINDRRCELEKEFSLIPEDRQQTLRRLGDYLAEKRMAGLPAAVTVICTHNSRRSHIGQLWILAGAACYGIDGVQAFSGGTEATAFNPRAVAALQRMGFDIRVEQAGDNPVYAARYAQGQTPVRLFSKKYDHPHNPHQGFAAVMVCSEADEACPFIPGAEARISLPFDDPKHFDCTPQELEKYDEACRLIGRDMLYACHHAAMQLATQNQ